MQNFPHHIHVEDDDDVKPGRLMNVIALLDVLEREIGETS